MEMQTDSGNYVQLLSGMAYRNNGLEGIHYESPISSEQSSFLGATSLPHISNIESNFPSLTTSAPLAPMQIPTANMYTHFGMPYHVSSDLCSTDSGSGSSTMIVDFAASALSGSCTSTGSECTTNAGRQQSVPPLHVSPFRSILHPSPLPHIIVESSAPGSMYHPLSSSVYDYALNEDDKTHMTDQSSDMHNSNTPYPIPVPTLSMPGSMLSPNSTHLSSHDHSPQGHMSVANTDNGAILTSPRSATKHSKRGARHRSRISEPPENFPIENKEKRILDRYNGLSEEEVKKKQLPDYLTTSLDMVIIGINPSLASADIGHHYGGTGNHFWECLYESGLVPHPVTCYDDHKMVDYGIGFTNFCTRPTKGTAELTRKELKTGIELLMEKIQFYKPKIAVFNGKGIYAAYLGHKNFNIGKQPEPLKDTNTLIFVMPSSSARCAQLPQAADKLPFFIALRKMRDWVCGKQGDDFKEDEMVFTDYTEMRISQPDPKSLLKAERRRQRLAAEASKQDSNKIENLGSISPMKKTSLGKDKKERQSLNSKTPKSKKSKGQTSQKLASDMNDNRSTSCHSSTMKENHDDNASDASSFIQTLPSLSTSHSFLIPPSSHHSSDSSLLCMVAGSASTTDHSSLFTSRLASESISSSATSMLPPLQPSIFMAQSTASSVANEGSLHGFSSMTGPTQSVQVFGQGNPQGFQLNGSILSNPSTNVLQMENGNVSAMKEDINVNQNLFSSFTMPDISSNGHNQTLFSPKISTTILYDQQMGCRNAPLNQQSLVDSTLSLTQSLMPHSQALPSMCHTLSASSASCRSHFTVNSVPHTAASQLISPPAVGGPPPSKLSRSSTSSSLHAPGSSNSAFTAFAVPPSHQQVGSTRISISPNASSQRQTSQSGIQKHSSFTPFSFSNTNMFPTHLFMPSNSVKEQKSSFSLLHERSESNIRSNATTNNNNNNNNLTTYVLSSDINGQLPLTIPLLYAEDNDREARRQMLFSEGLMPITSSSSIHESSYNEPYYYGSNMCNTDPCLPILPSAASYNRSNNCDPLTTVNFSLDHGLVFTSSVSASATTSSAGDVSAVAPLTYTSL